jgi:hypothetical protein
MTYNFGTEEFAYGGNHVWCERNASDTKLVRLPLEATTRDINIAKSEREKKNLLSALSEFHGAIGFCFRKWKVFWHLHL